jgi:zinc protease
MNLRENKGYSYGARGGFSYSRRFGEFTASSSVRADSTRQSVLEMVREVRQLQAGDMPATEAELSREKSGAMLGLPARFETSAATLGSYTDLVFFGLPLDYYSKYIDNIGAVTLDHVGTAARSQLRPDAIQILVVGDANAPQIMRDGEKDVPLLGADGKPMTLRAALEQLVATGDVGKGKLVVMDADGRVVK